MRARWARKAAAHLLVCIRSEANHGKAVGWVSRPLAKEGENYCFFEEVVLSVVEMKP
jgi:hypothetical protein